jgi:hypothetical protein
LETILILIITALVFGLFFLVFFLKETPKDQPARFHTCGDCNCHRSDSSVKRTTEPAAEEKPCHCDSAGV